MRDEPEGYNELTFNSLSILKSEHAIETYSIKDIDSKEELFDIDSKEELFYNLYNSCLPYITECIENEDPFELVDFVEDIFEDAEEDLTLEFLIYCTKKDLKTISFVFENLTTEDEDKIKKDIKKEWEGFIEYKKNIDADISNIVQQQS